MSSPSFLPTPAQAIDSHDMADVINYLTVESFTQVNGPYPHNVWTWPAM